MEPLVKAGMKRFLEKRAEIDQVLNVLPLQLGSDVMVPSMAASRPLKGHSRKCSGSFLSRISMSNARAYALTRCGSLVRGESEGASGAPPHEWKWVEENDDWCIYTHMAPLKNAAANGADIGAVCVAYNLRKSSRLISKFYQQVISRSGLQGTQFPLLYAIRRYQPIFIGDLAKLLDLDRTTLSRNLKLLEKKGYITFGSEVSDSRFRSVELTEQGAMMLEKAMPLWQEAQERIVGKFGEQRWQEMLQLLDELSSLAT